MKNSVIEVVNVTVKFQRWGQTMTALDAVSLSVLSNEWVVIVGHNGSGKSTLLRVIGQLLRPVSGDVTVRSQSKPCSVAQQKRIGLVYYVHQDPFMGSAPSLTVYENLIAADVNVRHCIFHKRDVIEKYDALLETVGLLGKGKRLVQNLSGGERQMLTLLVAELRPCEIILLDEPFSSLDPQKAEICLAKVKALHNQGRTLIQVTHEPNYATSLGTRTIAMREGRIVYDERDNQRDAAAVRKHWYFDKGTHE